ncbi:MAG: hypothetical protein ACLSAP_05950 [Oscillospiraceae bacterium]
MEFVACKNRAEELSKILRTQLPVLCADDPSIPDYAFEPAAQRAGKLEAEFPELVSPASPTQRAGGAAMNTFEKVEHPCADGKPAGRVRRSRAARNSTQGCARACPRRRTSSSLNRRIVGRAGIPRRAVRRHARRRRDGEDVTLNLKTVRSIR